MITITDTENKVLAWNINFGWLLPKIARILKVSDAKAREFNRKGKRHMEQDERARQINCKYMYYGNMDKYTGRNHNLAHASTWMTHRCLWEFLWSGATISSTAACMQKPHPDPRRNKYCAPEDCLNKRANRTKRWVRAALRNDGMIFDDLTPQEQKRVKALLEVRDE